MATATKKDREYRKAAKGMLEIVDRCIHSAKQCVCEIRIEKALRRLVKRLSSLLRPPKE